MNITNSRTGNIMFCGELQGNVIATATSWALHDCDPPELWIRLEKAFFDRDIWARIFRVD